MAIVVGAAILGVAACGSDDDSGGAAGSPEERNQAAIDDALAEDAIKDAVREHLVANGGVVAESDGPAGLWFEGEIRLLEGGESCGVSTIYVDPPFSEQEETIFSEDGSVAVLKSSTADENSACLIALRDALAGFERP